MNSMKEPTTDDQGNINKPLNFLRIKWMNIRPTQNINLIQKNLFGVVTLEQNPEPSKLIVMLMPFSTVCRQTCVSEKRNEYFVWHVVPIYQGELNGGEEGESGEGRKRLGSA
jgi:hypothetical protein